MPFDCDQRINRENLQACFNEHPSVQEFQFCVKRWLKLQTAKADRQKKANAPKAKGGILNRLRGAK